MEHEEIHKTFSHFVTEIRDRHSDLAYLHATMSRVGGNLDLPADERETLDFLVSLTLPASFIGVSLTLTLADSMISGHLVLSSSLVVSSATPLSKRQSTSGIP